MSAGRLHGLSMGWLSPKYLIRFFYANYSTWQRPVSRGEKDGTHVAYHPGPQWVPELERTCELTVCAAVPLQ